MRRAPTRKIFNWGVVARNALTFAIAVGVAIAALSWVGL